MCTNYPCIKFELNTNQPLVPSYLSTRKNLSPIVILFCYERLLDIAKNLSHGMNLRERRSGVLGLLVEAFFLAATRVIIEITVLRLGFQESCLYNRNNTIRPEESRGSLTKIFLQRHKD